MIIDNIDTALQKVREKYPNATREGSTYDWSFWQNGKLVAQAIMQRRAKTNKWKLTIYDTPKQA